MKAINETTGECIADFIEEAKTPLARMKGLLGRDSLSSGEGLFIHPCKGIHTFGMKFPIDIIFLNRENRVVAIRKSIPANRMSPYYFTASCVLELPAGTIECLRIVKGDRISIG
jgi:uncharacterized membrane protein (UPF0127 family)